MSDKSNLRSRKIATTHIPTSEEERNIEEESEKSGKVLKSFHLTQETIDILEDYANFQRKKTGKKPFLSTIVTELIREHCTL